MKFVNPYKDLIRKLYGYIDAVFILSSGYLPINLIAQCNMNGIITEVKKVIITTNPNYDLVIKRLQIYHDMKLETFAIDDNSDLIVQFQVFVQSYSQALLTLYEIEIVFIPIIDQNTLANSYSEIHISKPYIALSYKINMSLRHQELDIVNIYITFIVRCFLL